MPQNYSGRILLIGVVVLLALAALFPEPRKLFRSDLAWGQKINLKPGIDMQGGTSLLYEIKPPEGETTQSAATTYKGGLANEVMDALKRRIDPNGVRNLVWRPHGDTQLEIQMPATPESQAADALGQHLGKAREAMARTNVSSGEVITVIEHSPDAAARDKRLAELANGSKDREAVFKELVTAWDKRQAARKAGDPEAAADAQQAYTAAQAKIDSTNLRGEDLERVLDLQGADRERRLAELRKQADSFPARKLALDEYVKAHDAFSKVSSQINDVAQLKQKLKGAGVLEFHIVAGNDAPPAKVAEMQKRLQTEGPRTKAGDELKWFEVGEQERGKVNGITGEYNGKSYALAWITAEKSMDHRTGSRPWGLKGARRQYGQLGEAMVGFTFDEVGGQLFGDLSGNNINKPLAIVLDQKIISAPNLRARITDSGVIEGGSGGFKPEELDYLVDTLNAGSLKAQLADEPISERTVGPQLGADNLRRGLMSCVIGGIVVMLFMICYYYFSGLIACVALLLNLILILGSMAALHATFTLPGVAAIVLTIGMAVDANVLIYERLREEKARGLSINMALRNAYDRAFSAILDGNLTTALTSLVLFMFGSEEVKGFGLTLLIGIGASMFTALFVTKTIFGLLLRAGWIKDLRSFPETFPAWQRFLHPNVDWMGKAWMFYTFSTLFIISGLIAFGIRSAQGKMLDVEFSKGTSVQFDLKAPLAQDEVRKLIEEESHKNPKSLPSPQVVSAGTEDKSYEVVTPNPDAPAVRDAVMQALGDRLAVERPSEFKGAGQTMDEALASGTLVPITSATQQIAGFVPARLPAHVGGVALVLSNLTPALPPDQVKQRIERQHLQAESASEGSGYHAVDAEQAPAPGGQEGNTVVVLVSDPAFPYDANDPLKLSQWKDTVAGPAWKLANDSIRKPAQLQRVSNFDAQVAGNTTRDAIMALLISIGGIMAYIWARFGNLKYGLATVVALLHDVLLTLAAVGLAHYLSEVSFFRDYLLIEPFRLNLTLVAAILTVMGYSMNDTVVVFDRIRENRGRLGLLRRQVINDSVNQTLSRTLLTSSTTMTTVFIMYCFGGSGIHGFTFALLIGIIVGTYSSIAIAAPILLLGHTSDVQGENRAKSPKTDRQSGKLQGAGAT